MADCSELRDWAELIPDVLGLIFRNLSLQETLTIVPRVCKAWQIAVSGPYCWQDIDILEWSSRSKPEQLDRMLQMLITRSCGTCRSLSVFGLHIETTFTFIAEHANSLERLEMLRSEINDSVVQQVAPSFSNITFLDLSYCGKIGASALEAFGKNCKFLTELQRRMHPLEVQEKDSQDEEAYAIANTMPKLRRLEIPYLLLTTKSVLEILSRCKDLEYLDLRGCWDVEFEEEYLVRQHPGLRVLGPDIRDYYDDEQNVWEDCSDYSDSSVYSWDYHGDDIFNGGDDDDDDVWDDDEQELGLEFRFYGGTGNNEVYVGFEWPHSP